MLCMKGFKQHHRTNATEHNNRNVPCLRKTFVKSYALNIQN